MLATEAAYKNGLLDPDVHERLIANIDRITERAGIFAFQSLVWTPLATNCTEFEVEWMYGFRALVDDGKYGLLYEGHYNPPVEQRFRAMVGCMLRNYAEGKLMYVREVIEACEEGDMPMNTALFIPDFFLPKKEGGWRMHSEIGVLNSLLRRRRAAGKQTVVGVSGLADLDHEWGSHIMRVLSEEEGYVHVKE